MARSSASLGSPPAAPMKADAMAGLNAAAAAAAAAAGRGGAPGSAAGKAGGGELTLPPSDELGWPKLGTPPIMGPSSGSVGMGRAALSSVPVARNCSESTGYMAQPGWPCCHHAATACGCSWRTWADGGVGRRRGMLRWHAWHMEVTQA